MPEYEPQGCRPKHNDNNSCDVTQQLKELTIHSFTLPVIPSCQITSLGVVDPSVVIITAVVLLNSLDNTYYSQFNTSFPLPGPVNQSPQRAGAYLPGG